MIFYFSATGNSRYAAQKIAARLSDELYSINDRVKAGGAGSIPVNGPLVFVVPTYAWRIPRVVRDWILRTEFVGADRVWFVMTCGSEMGSAAKYNRALCARKGFRYMGTAQIVMPENYIAMFNAPETAEAREIVLRAGPSIDRAAEHIAAGQEFPVPRNNLYDRVMSGPVNSLFYIFSAKANAFTAGPSCTGCGQCARLCPLNNIALRGGRPVWGKTCTHCMACICRCPTQAIEYGKKTRGKPRYHIETAISGGDSHE